LKVKLIDKEAIALFNYLNKEKIVLVTDKIHIHDGKLKTVGYYPESYPYFAEVQTK